MNEGRIKVKNEGKGREGREERGGPSCYEKKKEVKVLVFGVPKGDPSTQYREIREIREFKEPKTRISENQTGDLDRELRLVLRPGGGKPPELDR